MSKLNKIKKDSEPMKNTPESNFKKVAAGVELEAIRLLNINARQIHLNSGTHEYSMEAGVADPVIRENDGKRFLLSIHRFKVSSQNQEKKSPVEMDILMEAVYEITDPTITESDCTEFAVLNVSHNLWPYFRELVQSTTSRMGLNPPLIIPLKKFTQQKPNSLKK